MAPLQPLEFEIRVPVAFAPGERETKATIVRQSEAAGTWFAAIETPFAARDTTPERAAASLAAVLRRVADGMDPLPETIVAMVRGLVRAAEFKEQEADGKIWDDECRNALAKARELGWGKHQVGTLGR